MAFEGLAEKLQNVFSKLTRRGKLSESDIKEAMREVRVALLEADVNFKVVRDFIKSVSDQAIGQDVMRSLTPGQHVIKLVHEGLIELMGKENSRLTVAGHPPSVYMMAGLQGSGKTTASAKLALLLKKQGRKPMLVDRKSTRLNSSP